MSQTQPIKCGRKSSTEEEGVSNTNLLQNIQSTIMKLLEVTSNKMDKMIEAINDLKEETKLNRIEGSENKGEVQAAVAKVGENIVKELHSIATSQNRTFQSMMADSDLKQLEIKLPEWKNLLNECKMAYFDFL